MTALAPAGQTANDCEANPSDEEAFDRLVRQTLFSEVNELPEHGNEVWRALLVHIRGLD